MDWFEFEGLIIVFWGSFIILESVFSNKTCIPGGVDEVRGRVETVEEIESVAVDLLDNDVPASEISLIWVKQLRGRMH